MGRIWGKLILAMALLAAPAQSSVTAANLFHYDRFELRTKAEAIWYAEQVLASGATPDAWANRAFVPASAIKAFAAPLVGTEYVLPNGNLDSAKRAKGFAHIKLASFDVGTVDGALTASFVLRATYKGDKEKPWWRGAKAALRVKALFVPTGTSKDEKGNTVTLFRLTPLTVSPEVSWGFLNLKANKMVSELIAMGVVEKFGEKALVAVPAIGQNFDVDTAIASESFSKFPKGGGFSLATTFAGKTFAGSVVMDRPLVAGSGIWLLGGAAAAPPSPPPPTGETELKAWVRQHEPLLRRALAPFQSSDDLIQVHLAKDPIERIASDIRTTYPAGLAIKLSSHGATGAVGEAFLMKDKLLGDIGVRVTPGSDDFVKGGVTLAFSNLAWTPGKGMVGTANASLWAEADLHAHLSTSFVGGGVGKDFRIRGESDVNAPFSLSLEMRPTPVGNAVVIQPAIGCTRVEVDVRPVSNAKLFDVEWFRLASLGVRLKRNLGDKAISPIVLFAGVPQYQPFVPDPKPGQPPRDERIKFPSKGFGWAINPTAVTIDATGITMTARATVVPSEGIDADDQKALKQIMLSAVEKATPKPACEIDQELALLIGNFELGPENELMVFAMKAIKAGQVVLATTVDQVEKFYKKPVDTLRSVPDNVLREGEQGVNNIGDEYGRAKKKAKKACKRWFGKKVCKWI